MSMLVEIHIFKSFSCMPVCLSLAIALQKALILVLCNNWKMLSEQVFTFVLHPMQYCIHGVLNKS